MQPHHLKNIHMAYKGRSVGEGLFYYNDEMKEIDVENIKKIIQNPTQPVKIVSGIDSLCAVCPHNLYKNEVAPLEKKYCGLATGKGIDSNKVDAEIYGVQNFIDKDPISAEQLINTMKSNASFLRGMYIIIKSAMKK